MDADKDAISAWNTRHAPNPQSAEVKELVKACAEVVLQLRIARVLMSVSIHKGHLYQFDNAIDAAEKALDCYGVTDKGKSG
jgi:hypothetical protein